MLLSENSPRVVWFLVKIFKINYHKWFIGREDIKWADSCVYLGVELKAGRTFTTLAEKNRRKFCASANDVIGNSDFLSEECVLEIIQKQCLPILIFGVGAWKLRVKDTRRLGVTFNRAI